MESSGRRQIFLKFNTPARVRETPRYSIGEVNLRILLAAALFASGACQRLPDAYSLPAQEPQFAGFKAHVVRMVNMDDPDAGAHFVRDIEPDLETSWRWAMQRPAVKIKVTSPSNLKYTIDFTLPEVTFRETGPVTLTFTVNGQVIDRVRYDHFGFYHFEKPIPEGMLKPESEVIVGAEIDKMWTSKTDGARFGFIITRMGLTE